MQYSKSLLISMAASAAILMSGCGSASTEASEASAAPAAVITVERGPLLDASVSDARGQAADELGNGQYAFENQPEYPVTAVGGYIDVNRNGKIDAGEVANTLKLQANAGDVVTIATSLSMDAHASELLEVAFDLKPEQVEMKTPGEDKAIEAFSNVVYAYAMENNISELSKITMAEVEALKAQYRETLQAYHDDMQDAAEHEEQLMQQLQMPTLDDADAAQVQQQLEEKYANTNGYFGDAEGQASSAAGEAQDQAGGMAEDAEGMMNEYFGDAQGQASSASSEAQDQAGGVAEDAEGMMDEYFGDAQGQASSASSEAQDQAGDMAEDTKDMMDQYMGSSSSAMDAGDEGSASSASSEAADVMDDMMDSSSSSSSSDAFTPPAMGGFGSF